MSAPDSETSRRRDSVGAKKQKQDGPAHVSPWEWVAGAVSLLLVLTMIGFLTFQAAARPGDPPRIELTVDTMIVAENGYLVEFTARNTGGRTVAQLQVQGELDDGRGEPEQSQTSIQHVPAGGARQAGLLFTRDPRGGTLELRPVGFDFP